MYREKAWIQIQIGATLRIRIQIQRIWNKNPASYLSIQIYPPVAAASGPDNERRNQLSGLLCYLGGLAVRILLDLVKYHIGERLATQRSFPKALGAWLYIGLYALAGVSFWRGVWYLMELDVGDKVREIPA